MYKTKDTSISFAFINTNREEDFLFPKCDLERYRFLGLLLLFIEIIFFRFITPDAAKFPSQYFQATGQLFMRIY